MNFDNVFQIVDMIAKTSWHIAIMLGVLSTLKLVITLIFNFKLAQVQKSEIIVRNGEKYASYSKPSQEAKIIKILNEDEKAITEEFRDKAS